MYKKGSWNAKKLRGYKVGLATLSKDKKSIVSYEPFLTGFTQEGNDKNGCGRPVDVVEMKDGSILVSDDYADRIYRITYSDV